MSFTKSTEDYYIEDRGFIEIRTCGAKVERKYAGCDGIGLKKDMVFCPSCRSHIHRHNLHIYLGGNYGEYTMKCSLCKTEGPGYEITKILFRKDYRHKRNMTDNQDALNQLE